MSRNDIVKTDGSINYNYLGDSIDGLSSQMADIAVNVKNFGAKGDGVTDDTNAIQNIFNNTTNKTIFFPVGVYRITDTLYLDTNCSIQLDDNATIILDSTDIKDFMFRYNSQKQYNNWDDLAIRKSIIGGKFDGNNKCKNLMELSLYSNFTLSRIQFYNFLEKGLITRGQILKSSGGLMGHELYFKNEQVNLGSIAIYNNGRDNKFYDNTIVNCSTVIWSQDGIFTKIHGWLNLPELIPDSLFADIQESAALFNSCIIDTIRYGFRLATTRKLRVNNPYFMMNETYYTTDYQTNYPPVLFDNTDATAYFIVHNMLTTFSHGTATIVSHYNKNNVFDDYILGLSATVYDTTGFDKREYLSDFGRGSITQLYNNDCNNATKNGAYEAISSNLHHPDGTTNGVILVANAGLSVSGNPLYLTQMYIPGNNNAFIYIRARHWSNNIYTWFDWQKISQ